MSFSERAARDRIDWSSTSRDGSTTAEGEKPVVVKVQRPGRRAKRSHAGSSSSSTFLAAAAESAIPEAKFYSPVGLVNQFDRSIMSELNYLIEAGERRKASRRTSRETRAFGFQSVYKEASSKHVLTMEFFDGIAR